MAFDHAPSQPRFLAPEVVQTSTMDCGPAALKCLLEGFGIPAHYGRLREACQTDVDGTSINAIEDVAVQLGLRAEQTMMPVDHMLLPESRNLPALVVTRQPNGLTHFVVVWSCHGPFVQVMDPATGRRWPWRKQFLNEVYRHALPVSATVWRTWAGSTDFAAPLRQRLMRLGLEPRECDGLIDVAREDTGWRAFAALDAATGLVTAVVEARGLSRGAEAGALVRRYVEPARLNDPHAADAIPDAFWSVQPLTKASGRDSGAEERLMLRGAVLIRVQGRPPSLPPQSDGERQDIGLPDAASADPAALSAATTTAAKTRHDDEPPPSLSPDLTAALEEAASQPEREIWHALRADGLLTPTMLVLALSLAAVGMTGEVVLFRGLMELGKQLGFEGLRFQLMWAICIFMALLLLLELPMSAGVLRMGRRLEMRLRLAFLGKIPRLGERYFHSRLTSDMAQRAHDLRQFRTIPILGSRVLRLACQLALTTVGIIWLAPESTFIALLALLWAVGLSLLIHPVLSERDMRVRTHIGALSRFYLDACLGLAPVRTHGAERALRREHENLLVEWARASLAVSHLGVGVQSVSALVSSTFAVWMVLNHLGSGASALLLLYWALSLPALGQQLVQIMQLYTSQRNNTLRLLEPLGTPDEEEMRPLANPTPMAAGVTIEMQDVDVQASGKSILRQINLKVAAGEHMAIVGPSGAGKSSLAGLLLGWWHPSAGLLLVDSHPLHGSHLDALRRATAWVDPAVQLWNRSLLDNLRYGAPQSAPDTALGLALEEADLLDILERLPDGLQTRLGEGGGLVSGGEGQRVRLGRALLRPDIRLVILDEPFRGLDRDKRRALLAVARRYWRHATLICITHDVGETQSFERVAVIEDGHIREDGAPAILRQRPNSRYGALLESEKAVRSGMWQGAYWRRLWIDSGQLRER